jgi:hypothetical protein
MMLHESQYFLSSVANGDADLSDWMKELTHISTDFVFVDVDCTNQLYPRLRQQNFDNSDSDGS